MRLSFWLLIFAYYANIHAADIKPSLDLWKFSRELLENENRSEPQPYNPLLIIIDETRKPSQTDGTDEESTHREYIYKHYFPDEVQVKPIQQLNPPLPRTSALYQTSELIFRKADSEKIKFLCPVDMSVEENERVIEGIAEYRWDLRYCLVEQRYLYVTGQPKVCSNEVKPMVMPVRSTIRSSFKQCGPNLKYELLHSVYMYCETISKLEYWLTLLEEDKEQAPTLDELFPSTQPKLELYNFCYDKHQVSVLYTHHRIFPSLLRNQNYFTKPDNISISLSEKIQTSAQQPAGIDVPNIPTSQQTPTGPQFYHEKVEKFARMKKAFNNQANVSYRMKPQMLVPTADLPFPLWKKSTYSYFNIAPLWERLVPLMDLINDRIRRLAIKHSKKLSVYSATFNVDFKNYKKLYLNDTQSLVIPTVWSKLVYDEERKSATAILLHNTPDNEFKSNRLCAPGEQITCNFINWLDSSALKNTIDKKTITETAQYAYCCQVRKKSNIMTEYYGIYAVKAEADIVDIDYPKRT